ncbi:hypothetical protein VTK56DRAFT_6059 [Thermocarpiscus australiensis]
MYLRTKSPLYSASYDEVVQRTCSVLRIPYDKSRLLAIQKWTKLAAMVFDVFYDDYDVSTAHHKVNLPVLLVVYGRARSHVRVASDQFREFINGYVATQHNYHGWDARPPYFEDQTGAAPPKYENPRDPSIFERYSAPAMVFFPSGDRMDACSARSKWASISGRLAHLQTHPAKHLLSAKTWYQ